MRGITLRYPAFWMGLYCLALPALAAATQRYLDPVFSGVEVSRDLAYGPSPSHRLDAYVPAGDVETDRPAVLLIHGGGFTEGYKEQDLYQKMATEFALRGYVAFSINYRLAKPVAVPSSPDTAVADAAAALAWIQSNSALFGLDPKRIAIGGDSAGGNIAVSLCYRNGAAAGAAACLDLWGGMFSASGRWNAPIYPGPIPAAAPPTLLVHGTVDSVVPYRTSLDLAAQLQVAGVYHELLTLDGANHYPQERAAEFIGAMVDFIYRRVAEPQSTAVIAAHEGASPPAALRLAQNYPNPFNAGTVIRFDLPRAGQVDLAVLNSVGQRVATLLRGTQGAGAYTVTWDGRDDRGQALASGVYLVRLRTASAQLLTRALLLR